jgi:LAO/AO transport system kinase
VTTRELEAGAPARAREPSRVDDGLIEGARARDKRSVSTLISLFEDQRPEAISRRAGVLEALRREGRRASATLGVTGTPGSGKSSLLARVSLALLEKDPSLSVAVLAVDPSSPISGGALLGDRTRMSLPHGEHRLFFRSQASATELGGLGPWTFQVARLLSELFDCLIVETVGIGQSEADVRHLADRVYLVMQPLGGDEIQFLKAGIMEIPHAFVLNKCDEPSAQRSYHALRSSLLLARADADEVPILRTSARDGTGIDALCDDMLAALRAPSAGARDKETYFFERWVRDEWGRFGVGVLDRQWGGAAGFLEQARSFERAQADLSSRMRELAPPR